MEFVATSDKYEGSDLAEWFAFSGLKESSQELMTNLGLEDFADLVDTCSDEESLRALSDELPKLEYVKFKKAVRKTKNITSPAAMIMETITRSSLASRTTAMDSKGKSSFSSTLDSTTTTHCSEGDGDGLTELRARVARAEEEERLLETLKSVTTSIAHKKDKKARDAEKKRLTAALASTSRTIEDKEKKNRTTRKKNARRMQLKGLERHIEKAASLDICFLEDCTGSMSSHIKACSEHIVAVAQSVKDFYPQVPLRLAYIGYRDHCDGDLRLAVHSFSTDMDAFQRFVGSQRAIGGGDAPEDVFGALNEAVRLDWQAATKLMFHIGDGPCHGTRFHSCGDSYPGGDPNGLRAEALLPAIQQKGIVYKFGRINSSTDKMISEFNKILGGHVIETMDVADASTLMGSVATSVTESLYTSLSSSVFTTHDGGRKKIDRDEIEFETSEPRWEEIRAEDVNIFSMVMPETMSALLGEQPSTFVDCRPSLVSMKVSALPFDAGAVRVVHRAKRADGSGPCVVHKTPMSQHVKDKVREKFERSHISTHAAATFLALEFNKVRPGHFPAVEYVHLSLVHYLTREGTPYCTEEPALIGHYEKYNNNSGMVVASPTKHGVHHEVVQAFSHWTYSATDGFLCVVDCQGVYDSSSKTFRLTDPAIHCEDMLRYGGTNLHSGGFKRFFATHKCNDCCRALGLATPSFD